MVVAVNELSEEEITNDKPVQGFKEPAFIFLPAEHPSIVTLRYILLLHACPCSNRFNSEKDMFSPSFPYPNLFLHTAPPQPGSTVLQLPARSLYLANSVVKALIENNDYIRMRLVAAGTKVLNRQEKDGTHFRMMDEGLEALLPYIRDGDVVEGNLEDLRVLLAEYAPFFNKLKEGPFTDSLANRRASSQPFHLRIRLRLSKLKAISSLDSGRIWMIQSQCLKSLAAKGAHSE
jgi:multisite-specific tRNA:(cytosine-C5)-methyltransferase